MRFTVLRSFAFVLASAALLGGCGKQSEGEVCEIVNGNDDCESGLECVSSKLLLDESADRCCPAEDVSNPDCRRGGRFDPDATGGTGGSGGTAGAAGTTPAAGGSAGAAGSADAAGSAGVIGRPGSAGAAGVAGSFAGGTSPSTPTAGSGG